MVSKFQEFHGGVEKHVEELMAGLRTLGHEVELFTSEDVISAGGSIFNAQRSEGKSDFQNARELLWNRDARNSFHKKIADFNPDLVHFHSIYHQLSPSLLSVFRGPKVMTLHDYKFAAPCYSLYREEKICTLCVGKKFPYPAIINKCISENTAASGLCATEHAVHKQRYLDEINQFIVPSDYSRKIMIDSGIPERSLSTVSWGVSVAKTENFEVMQLPNKFILFFGRLHETKGLKLVLDAWGQSNVSKTFSLVIAGKGPLEAEVRKLAESDPSILFLGLVEASLGPDLISRASATLVPSLFPETMGLTAVESLVLGTPIISSGRGALEDLNGNGTLLLEEPMNSSLVTMFDQFASDKTFLKDESQRLQSRDLCAYSIDAMLHSILDVYSRILSERKF